MPGIGDLAGELNDVVQRVPSRAFQKLEGHGPLELPHLWAVAERVLPGAWETDPSDALEQLLRLAIDRLEGDFNGAISNQHAAYLLFNLDGAPSLPEVKPLDLDGVDGKHSSKIIQRLKKAAVLPPRGRTHQPHVTQLRRSLAKIMLDPDFGHENTSIGQTSPIDPLAATSQRFWLDLDRGRGNEPYVHRTHIESRFRRLRELKVPVICFVGPPGMGKTKVAEELTKTEKHPGGVTVRINAGSDEQLERSLFEVLRSVGHEQPPHGLAALESTFQTYVVQNSPWYVFIDNITDARLVPRLVPSTAKTTVVLTSGQRLSEIPEEYAIAVAQLEPDESVALILKLLPRCTKAEAGRLASVLAYHPMAITAACGLLGQDDSISINGFCSGLREVATTVFDGLSQDGHQNLVAIYRNTLAALNAVDPAARLLLEMIAHLGDDSIHSSVLVLGLKYVDQYKTTRIEQRKVIAKRAVLILRDRFLVSVEDDFIRLHQLARSIVRGLTSERAPELRQALFSGLLKVAEKIVEYAHNTPSVSTERRLESFGSIFRFLGSHLVDLLRRELGIDELEPDAWAIHRHVEALYKAVAAILTVVGVDPLRTLVAVVAGPHDSYEVRLVATQGELPLQIGIELDRAELDEAAGPSRKFVIQRGRRRYTIGDRRVQMPIMLWARAEDMESASSKRLDD